ncbi:uncharacterized protein LOC117819934 isoform X4 [Notolabrus celidotus]|uniref:uncharacterized protein LOC117819934 isoform X4 n=1 Tax=Notolabrus celidotus TaxID=1203425 RepID=UPI001490038F|nr:uncharacterized protein LOC117819934 isoform X4 [Notolabrus celidotus]
MDEFITVFSTKFWMLRFTRKVKMFFLGFTLILNTVSDVVLRNMLGYRGYSVTLVCNNSGANTTQISWTKEVRSLWYSPKMVIPVTGVLLCCIIAALCLCRKLRRKTPNPNPAQSPNMQNSEEQIGAERNSQYMERLNSIYNT